MRSNGGLDLNEFSVPYGGGGHASAAGITLKSTIEEAVSLIVPAMEKELSKT
jgi:nanoRNase/pAp phosphatase (c-di-AMP/oligoRNAs hydrolase)